MADDFGDEKSKYFPPRNQAGKRRIPTNNDCKTRSKDLKKRRRNSSSAKEDKPDEKDQKSPAMLSAVLTTSTPSTRLGKTDFARSGLDLAKFLLGKVIHRVLDNGEQLSGRIVETEAYLGEEDKACHAYGGKKTERTEAMYMDPGTAYVYFIYGMYFCLNISSQDVGGCVLIRALQPVNGQDTMQRLRSAKRKPGSPLIKEYALCNGPSKLCTALLITKDSLNKENMVTSTRFWVEKDQPDCLENEIVKTKRIGIDSYGIEWASKPYRFYILGNKSVSVRDKAAENALKQ